LRFRGTTSIDIRAPTLDDLFRPATLVQNVFTDLHVPDRQAADPVPQYYSATTTFSSQGNPHWCRKWRAPIRWARYGRRTSSPA
jgi:hypothetical protein